LGLLPAAAAVTAKVAAALELGQKIGDMLGISEWQRRSPAENLRIRQQQVDTAYARAIKGDQAAVLLLWIYTGIAGVPNSLVTDAAKEYAVAKLRAYYDVSGAEPLPGEWMEKLTAPQPWRAPMLGTPPVPGSFVGAGGIFGDIGDTLGGALEGNSMLLAVGAALALFFFAGRKSHR